MSTLTEASMTYRPGDVVETAYGVGVIVRFTTSGSSSSTTTSSDVGSGALDAKGRDCSSDGALSEPSSSTSHPTTSATSFAVVRLWRIPGKSLASTALAFLQVQALRRKLPAAPGMVVSLRPDSVPTISTSTNSSKSDPEATVPSPNAMVYTYYPDRHSFLVAVLPSEIDEDVENSSKDPNVAAGGDSPTNSDAAYSFAALRGDDRRRRRRSSAAGDVSRNLPSGTTPELVEVPVDAVVACLTAKFAPVLETLMDRAEMAARQTAALLSSESAKRVVNLTNQVVKDNAQLLVQTAESTFVELRRDGEGEGTGTSIDTLSRDVASKVEALVPEAEASAKHVLELVRDKDFTDLLEACQERLRQLVQHPDVLTEATLSALERTGIRIAIPPSSTDASVSNSLAESMELSRRAALCAVEQLLERAHVSHDDLDAARHELTSQFGSAFDSIAKAAQSDPSLQSAFDAIQDRTAEWQQITGRLLATRSANLFMEGATRLQARALAMFQASQLQWAGEVGSLLTKSFTEGDAALARLKSIELGDAVKNRLVEAIQVRSESLGGLDGIIAGALSSFQSQTSMAVASSAPFMKQFLSDMRDRSSTATTEAHETLLAVLSSRSLYRDVALLRIEAALVNLEQQLGDTMSPEDLAAIVAGEGGTARIFEPIAQRAMKQIEAQLDVAEGNVTDPTALEVLKRVRKIMSGELTVNNVMDELVSILNDDQVVAAGETLVQQSEHVLDVIEGATGNQAVTDALLLAEKAGITKDTVMKEIEKLNVNELLDTAGSAVTDERARRKLLSHATDTALDFLLRILPSMPVPPFEGVNEGLVYNISNLSMEGFKVRKEDIQIELAGMRATRRASSLLIRKDVGSMPLNGSSEHSHGSNMDMSFDVEEVHTNVKATELLIIDVRNISATLENAKFSFEQTYMPYLKGSGSANVKLSGGAIRLQFELRKRLVPEESDQSGPTRLKWEPVLCLHDRTCTISDVGLSLQGQGSLNWILNKLASIFKGPLRDYVVRTIVNVLTSRSGWILERLNAVLAPYWELILRTAQLEMSNLIEADENVVVKETSSDDRTMVELVWRERLPLGMNLLMNDESGLLKVVDFPRGSQARAVCEKRGLDPELFKGATIVGVNGAEYDDQDDLFDALKDPGRPKTVRFELADTEDAERIRRFVQGDDEKQSEAAGSPDDDDERQFRLRDVEFAQPGELGLEFAASLDNVGLVVQGFIEGPGGIVLAAEKTGLIAMGDLLVKINGEIVISSDGSGRNRAIQLLGSAGRSRPLVLTFAEPYLFAQVIDTTMVSSLHADRDGGPQELVLEDHVVKETGTKRVVLKGFDNVSGSAESSGIMIGDHLVFVNGMPVGAGCRWLGVSPPPTLAEIHGMMSHEKAYPMGLTFARPRQQQEISRWSGHRDRMFSDDEAETMCVTFEHPTQLGCLFEETRIHDVVVADFQAVPGVFQRALRRHVKPKMPLSVDSINGQFVPSYATKDMVRSAIQRSWKSDGRVVLWLCDDTHRHWIHAIAQAAATTSPSGTS